MYILKQKSSYLLIEFEPLVNIQTFDSFTDDIVGENQEVFFTKEFRYSTDNITFSAWEELSDVNLQALTPDSAATYYLQFKYTQEGEGELVFNDFTLNYTEVDSTSTSKTVNQKCCSVVENVGSYVDLSCDTRNIFDPSKLKSTYELTNQINEWIGGVYGHCVKYYRTDPEESSRDVILKEHSLFNVVSVKDINIVVPDNEFPDNAPEFTPFDMDFMDMPWQVQIGVREWCKVFGEETNPKRQDVIYFPLTNRVYEIESAYLFKDFVDKGTFWKINLVKYQEKASRGFSETLDASFEEELDALTQSVDDAFGKEREEDIEKIVKEYQYELISPGEYDSTRLGLAESLAIKTENLTNNYTVFSKYNYDLGTASAEFVSPFDAVAVEYRKKPTLQVNQNLAFTSWFKINKEKPNSNKLIESIVPFDASQATVTFSFNHNFLTGEIIKISGINDVNGLYEVTVVSDTEIRIIKSLVGSYTNLSGVGAQKQNITQLLHGYDNDTTSGIIFGVMNHGIVVKSNANTYLYEFSFNINEWYGIVINVGNVFDQISAYVYNRENEANGSSKLNRVFEETKVLAKAAFDIDDTYKMIGGYTSATNLRLFEQIIEPEKQSLILSQYVVKDNQLATIIDNAIPPLKLARTKETN